MKVLIVGAGKLGYELAKHMVIEDIDVTLMDINPKILEGINEHMDVLTINASGIDIKVLKEINIETYNLLVAATSTDETNTVICSLAKKLGCRQTVARIRNPEYMEQLDFIKKEMGIDHIINPDLATARAIEKYLLKSHVFYSESFASGRILMIDFNINHQSELVGKEIMNLNGFDNLLITAISRDGKIIIPKGSTILEDKDIIYIIGERADINHLASSFDFEKLNKDIENVVILGGSNIAYYLAKELERSKISVKIIERDKERAQELTNILDDTLMIHGDGTDINLLEEEVFNNMDAFISVTGLDEQNLLMALMAKQTGISKSIAKISRQNYGKIIDKLEIDAALNPINIAASNILKFIRGGKVISMSLLLGGDAEVIEIVIGEDSPFINIPLVNLPLSEKVIIGAILRRNKVIIPKGDTRLQPNDRIVVFCLTEDLQILKKFFASHKGGLLGELWNRAKGSRHNTHN